MEYLVVLVIIGVSALGMAWMPALSKFLRLSYAVIYVAAGALFFWALPMLPNINPFQHPEITLHLTEIVVLVALMGSGLKIDQVFRPKIWRNPLRLVTTGLVLSVAVTALVAWYFFQLDLASAILIGAILSPTDPVLASDVQVGPPQEGKNENVQFTLTAEGGMNDGTAFPFVWLGILFAGASMNGYEGWLNWSSFYLLYKLAAGLGCGVLLGKLIAYLLFSLPEKYRAARIEDGFVALSVTLLVYGTTELIKGYGFIAVFACAVTLRNYEMGHELHRTLHSFSDQIERILVAIVLLLFGGSLIDGILAHLSWQLAFFGIVFLLVIRPIITFMALLGTKMPRRERATICFFGIRGVGSLFYMSFAMAHTNLKSLPELWSLTAFVILLSIVIHGFTAPTAITKLQKARQG